MHRCLLVGAAAVLIACGQKGGTNATSPPCKLEEPPPEKLSATHCVREDDPRTPSDAFVPYTVNVAFFSDGAEKDRFLYVPEGKKIHVEDDGRWALPEGSVVEKKFFVQGYLTETRFMVRHEDGSWGAYTYVWDSDRTDATRAIYTPQLPSPPAPLITPPALIVVGGQKWQVPSTQCYACHQYTKPQIDTQSTTRGTVGLTTEQLNRPAPDGVSHQFAMFEALGWLDDEAIEKLHGPRLPQLVAPYDAGASIDKGLSTFSDLELRARSYLAANCSHCHHPNGQGGGTLDLRFSNTTAQQMKLCNVSMGIMPTQYFVPGDPQNSLIYQRVVNVQMPPNTGGHLRQDDDATALLYDWIVNAPKGPAGATGPTTATPYCVPDRR